VQINDNIVFNNNIYLFEEQCQIFSLNISRYLIIICKNIIRKTLVMLLASIDTTFNFILYA